MTATIAAPVPTTETPPVTTAKSKLELLQDGSVSRQLPLAPLQAPALLAALRPDEILVLRTYDAGKHEVHAFGPDRQGNLGYFVASKSNAIKGAWALLASMEQKLESFVR